MIAYTDPNAIHLLDLADRSDRIIHDTEPGTEIRNLTWAPDGTSLVFHVYAFGLHTQFKQEWKMYSISDEGAGLTLMFDRAGPETFPAYAPDGRLAYWGNHGLYINGSLFYSFVVQEDQSAPAWSPDGRFLAFSSGWELLQLNLEDTSEVTTIVESGGAFGRIREPAFSPGGTSIAFVHVISETESELWLTDMDGAVVRLTSGQLDRNPCWSNDGSAIAFVRNRIAIYTIDALDGAKAKLLTRHPVKHIAWVW